MTADLPHPPLSILFQDEWIVAVDKPAGQLVHPAENPQEGDAVTMKILRDQIGHQVHVIHRLDRPTSGVLIFAIDPVAARRLHAAFEKHEIQKVYWAVVDGHPVRDNWTCREPIKKDEGAVERSAETKFCVLDRLIDQLALVEAKPKTGRFHQIRRHLLHAGHPIVGDYRYAGVDRSDSLGAQLGTGTRMLLQAKSLRFLHPMTGTNLAIEAPTDSLLEKAMGRSL